MNQHKEILDVVIIGAGISGIGTAYWLQQKCPSKKFASLEARESFGGTWSLFRYPGVRSDSDMFTFGYKFKPWQNPKALSSGPDILNYLEETIKENKINEKIRFNHRLLEAHWSDTTKTWTLKIQKNEEQIEIVCRFLSVCSGYFSYSEAYRPHFEKEESFKGTIVHPQFWPEKFDFSNKKVVIVGSGATAITLVPAMSKEGAASVTMLQRSPSYISSIPNSNKFFNFLRKHLSPSLSYKVIRRLLITLSVVFYGLSRTFPEKMKAFLIKNVARQLPPNFDVEKHFTPKYKPWDQRMCLVPDGDLFKAIRSGKANVVTDEIMQYTEKGIQLKSGEELEADLIVLATGLKVKLMGQAKFFVNNKELILNEHLIYKGMMVSNVPNLIYAFGYTNASWTLKVDLTANYLCKLLNFMDKKGFDTVLPEVKKSGLEEPLLMLNSGYVLRAIDELPKQGKKLPWRVYQNYFVDMIIVRFGKINNGVLKFVK